ncbi:MAG: SRPBCC family protein [Pyrinomonadaceae bacterium]
MVKKVILAILGALLLVVVVISVVVASQPAEYSVTQSASFNATPERVFEHVNNFHKWEAWSPWARIDPAMKSFYSGPESGVGAVYEWSGNDEVGRGKMAIAESGPGELIKIDLDFIEPFASKTVTEFRFKPNGDKTDVTWTMSGKKDFVTKAVCLVMDMDKMVGPDFEKGLAQMKPVVETAR